MPASALRRASIVLVMSCWRDSSRARRRTACARVDARGLDDVDDLAVLVADGLDVGRLLEQVREALGAHDHRDEIRLRRLVELDEPGREDLPRLAQPRAEADDAAPLGAQLLAQRRELGAVGVELRLDLGLAVLDHGDVVSELVRRARRAG